MTPPTRTQIAFNLQRLRQRIDDAAEACGRDPRQIRLVGVTKYVDATVTRMLFECGCHDLGESRPQSLVDKAASMATLDVRWHLIGSLQRNKVAKVLPVAELIHSVDSRRLAETISRIATENESVQDILLQVNISQESAKHGFSPDKLPAALDVVQHLPGLRIRGLMGMAGLDHDESAARREFASLYSLREALSQRVDARHTMDELSMGMSGDFEWAIAEGATLVRIGSMLFETDSSAT